MTWLIRVYTYKYIIGGIRIQHLGNTTTVLPVDRKCIVSKFLFFLILYEPDERIRSVRSAFTRKKINDKWTHFL